MRSKYPIGVSTGPHSALRLVTLALEENENLRIREFAQKNIVSVHEQREIAQMCR
jgi:hypothetical protein